MRSLARLSFAVLTALVMSVCFSATRAALAQGNGTSGIIISEFRLDGPNGSGDEFVEIVNNNAVPKTIVSSDAPLFTGFSVWGVVAGAPRKICTIPNGTLLNPGQHYLCARTTAVAGYELGNYGTPDFSTQTLEPVNSLAVDGGIALFSSEDVQINNDGTFFSTLGTVFREDAVGFRKKNSDTFPLSFAPVFREGAGLFPIGPQDPAGRAPQNPNDLREYSFVRKHQTTGTTWAGATYQDTNDNVADWFLASNFGDVNILPAGAAQATLDAGFPILAGSNFDPSPPGFPGSETATVPIFGAPGPQGRANPTERNYNTQFLRSLFDTGSAANVSPNIERNTMIVCGGTRGDLVLRYTYRNATGVNQSNLRVRYIDLPTINRNNPGSTAVLDLLDANLAGASGTPGTRRVFVNNGRDNTTTATGNDPTAAPGDGSGGNPAGDGITNQKAGGGAGVKVVRGTYVEGVDKTPQVIYTPTNPPAGFTGAQAFRQVNPTLTDTDGSQGTPCRVGGINSATVSVAPTGGSATNAGITTTALPATLRGDIAPGGSISLEHRFGVIRQGTYLIVGIIESN